MLTDLHGFLAKERAKDIQRDAELNRLLKFAKKPLIATEKPHSTKKQMVRVLQLVMLMLGL
jgi:hypothetical protein